MQVFHVTMCHRCLLLHVVCPALDSILSQLSISYSGRLVLCPPQPPIRLCAKINVSLTHRKHFFNRFLLRLISFFIFSNFITAGLLEFVGHGLRSARTFLRQAVVIIISRQSPKLANSPFPENSYPLALRQVRGWGDKARGHGVFPRNCHTSIIPNVRRVDQ